MENIMQNKNMIDRHNNIEKKKAAYALNLCTVSVSQIVDYHDAYILEQEYDAILNNLNLKEIPKDEALLRTLSEILNTITFFHIQDIKKNQIEKKYRQRMKNAIWSAIPSLNIIVGGNPLYIAYSLATQIGSAYMNYRREKIDAASEKEDEEIELQITAIEQLNALRRELFSTAWRLADEYDFPDEWRLTEKQIKQYNNILIDKNDYRRYSRLESIADKFEAYPPFWYFYGHTANFISEMAKKRLRENKGNQEDIYKDSAIFKQYRELAKNHFEKYHSLIGNNILREDQLTASFALEYVDILCEEDTKDVNKINELIRLAEMMSPNSLDILQLCSIAYLKIGKTDEASRLLKLLVNEDYNGSSNAKILSRIYVNKYLTSKDNKALSEYRILEMQIDPKQLYPMPKNLSKSISESELDKAFIEEQKTILKIFYRRTLTAFANKKAEDFNRILPAPYKKNIPDSEYFSNTMMGKRIRRNVVENVLRSKEKEEYVSKLQQCEFRAGYIDILNQTVASLEDLSGFRHLSDHDDIIYMIEGKLRIAKSILEEIQEKLNANTFSFEYYKKLDETSYEYFTEDFYDRLKDEICNMINRITKLDSLEIWNNDIREFCDKNALPSPDRYISNSVEYEGSVEDNKGVFFTDALLGNKVNRPSRTELEKLSNIVNREIKNIIIDASKVDIYTFDDDKFNTYFANSNLLKNGSVYHLKYNAFAVIDDVTRRDYDLILCFDWIAVFYRNELRDIISYSDIQYESVGGNERLKLGYPCLYHNKNINIKSLFELISDIRKNI